MSQSIRLTRVVAFAAHTAPLIFYSALAKSEPSRAERACSASYQQAERKEQAGELLEARELYEKCASSACSSFLVQACSTRHLRLDGDIPSVVLVVSDRLGAPKTDVQVTLDGDAFASKLDGLSRPINPGMHELSFSADHEVFATVKLMIVQGDRNRRIEVPFALSTTSSTSSTADSTSEMGEGREPDRNSGEPSKAPAEQAPVVASKHVPAMSYVLGGLGVLGGVGYGVLSLWGRKDNDALTRECKPACEQSSVDHVKRVYLAANVSLGVGIAALTSAVLVYAISGPSSRERPRQQAYTFSVAPSVSGATANFSRSF